MSMRKSIVIALGAAALLALAGIVYAQSDFGLGPDVPEGMYRDMDDMPGFRRGGMGHGPRMLAMMHGGMQGGPGGGMHGGQHSGRNAGPSGDQGPASLAFNAVNEKMHRGMAIVFSGNTDVDFVRGMIPHHQGAVDMAKILLAFGKDPEIRKLAEEIVRAQETEIAFMQSWLAKQGK
jgi:uncharacterized protein (DUF305 family)